MSVAGKKVKIDKCTEERVTLQKGGCYCRMCYAGLKDLNLTKAEKRKKANKSTMGCGWCKVLVCGDCWKSYDHTL